MKISDIFTENISWYFIQIFSGEIVTIWMRCQELFSVKYNKIHFFNVCSFVVYYYYYLVSCLLCKLSNFQTSLKCLHKVRFLPLDCSNAHVNSHAHWQDERICLSYGHSARFRDTHTHTHTKAKRVIAYPKSYQLQSTRTHARTHRHTQAKSVIAYPKSYQLSKHTNSRLHNTYSSLQRVFTSMHAPTQRARTHSRTHAQSQSHKSVHARHMFEWKCTPITALPGPYVR